jgi:hypothetical protein
MGGDRKNCFACKLGAEEIKEVLHLCRTDNLDSTLGGDTASHFREAVTYQVKSSSHRIEYVQSKVGSRG